MVPSEATEPAVAAEVAPTMEVMSKAAEEPAAPTPAAVEETLTPEDAPAPDVAEEKPAEEKSEKTKGNPFTKLCIFLFLIQDRTDLSGFCLLSVTATADTGDTHTGEIAVEI